MKKLDTLMAFIRALDKKLESFGVSGLWLFGSAARGEADVKDLDFLVEFIHPPTLTTFMNLKFFLEEKLRMPVDLNTRSSCPDRFMLRIKDDLLHVA